MTFGSRYGNFAKRPVGLKTDGKLRAGSAKYPPIEAVKASVRSDEEGRSARLTSYDGAYAPDKRHYCVRLRCTTVSHEMMQPGLNTYVHARVA
jgi:hypothetical protein